VGRNRLGRQRVLASAGTEKITEGKIMTVESNLHTAAAPLERWETPALIGSDKVAGTAVYSSDGRKMGRIERVMIGK